MRGLAQLAFGVFVVFTIGIFKEPVLLFAWYPVAGLCSLPVLYYVVFERHRETRHDDVIQQLEMIRNAISELRTSVAGSSPVR